MPSTPYAGLRNNCPESIWMWVGPTPQCRTPRKHGIQLPESPVRSAQPRLWAIGQLHHLWSSLLVHVSVSMQRGNTWVAKRSIFYNMYSYVLRRHTRHPVELLRSEQCYHGQRRINVSIRTKRPDRAVVGPSSNYIRNFV